MPVHPTDDPTTTTTTTDHDDDPAMPTRGALPSWLTPAEEARFRAKFVPEGECWLWQGPPDKDGYGTFYLRKRSRRAHRVAWFRRNGPIPDDMVINHTCRRRACVNPDHLEVVTTTENTFRNSLSAPALNRLKTTCPEGHPFDRTYGGQRYCSICEAAKTRRLRKKWAAEAAETKC